MSQPDRRWKHKGSSNLPDRVGLQPGDRVEVTMRGTVVARTERNSRDAGRPQVVSEVEFDLPLRMRRIEEGGPT